MICRLICRNSVAGELKNKIENALNEARILILGGQVLIGAAFRLTFMDGFDKLPLYSQTVHLLSLWLMLLGFGILLIPAPYHFLVEDGEDTKPFHELVTRILEWALLPFASGLAVSVFLVGEQSMSGVAGIVAGTAIFAAALFIWYIFSVLKTTRRPSPIPQQEPTKLREKIKQGLIEA